MSSFGLNWPFKSKVDTILRLEPPKTKTELKSFVGMLTFYGTSLPLLQCTLEPLHRISGATKKFVWGEEQQLAFERAKEILTKCTHLAFPSENSKLILTTDASDKAFGGCLSELNEKGIEVPIRYFSGCFKGPELNYIIREKEFKHGKKVTEKHPSMIYNLTSQLTNKKSSFFAQFTTIKVLKERPVLPYKQFYF